MIRRAATSLIFLPNITGCPVWDLFDLIREYPSIALSASDAFFISLFRTSSTIKIFSRTRSLVYGFNLFFFLIISSILHVLLFPYLFSARKWFWRSAKHRHFKSENNVSTCDEQEGSLNAPGSVRLFNAGFAHGNIVNENLRRCLKLCFWRCTHRNNGGNII